MLWVPKGSKRYCSRLPIWCHLRGMWIMALHPLMHSPGFNQLFHETWWALLPRWRQTPHCRRLVSNIIRCPVLSGCLYFLCLIRVFHLWCCTLLFGVILRRLGLWREFWISLASLVLVYQCHTYWAWWGGKVWWGNPSSWQVPGNDVLLGWLFHCHCNFPGVCSPNVQHFPILIFSLH